MTKCLRGPDEMTSRAVVWSPCLTLMNARWTSGGSKPDVLGGSQISGRQKVFTCSHIPASLRQSLDIT